MSDGGKMIGTYFGQPTYVDDSDVDLIEIRQGISFVNEQVVMITPEMAPKLREILNKRYAEGRE